MMSNTANGELSAANPQYTATAIELPLKVVVTRDDAKYDSDETPEGENMVFKTIELAHYYTTKVDTGAGTNGVAANSLAAAYWNANHTFLTYSTSPKTDKVVTGVSREKYTLYATYHVTVKIDESVDPSHWSEGKYTDSNGGVWTKAELAAELATKNISVTLKAKESNGTTDTRARLFSLVDKDGTVTVAAGSDAPSALDTELPSTIPDNGNESVAFAKFGLYVDGEDDDDNIDGNLTTVSGNFQVIVAAR